VIRDVQAGCPHIIPEISSSWPPQGIPTPDLTVAFVLEGSTQAFENFGAGDQPLCVPLMLAEIIDESPVIRAADIGIGGCLGVFAAGEQHMILGIVRSAYFLTFQVVFPCLPTVNIDRGRQKPLFDGVLRRQGGKGCRLTGAGSGMAGIQQHFQADPCGELFKNCLEIIVLDVGPIPVHVMRA